MELQFKPRPSTINITLRKRTLAQSRIDEHDSVGKFFGRKKNSQKKFEIVWGDLIVLEDPTSNIAAGNSTTSQLQHYEEQDGWEDGKLKEEKEKNKDNQEACADTNNTTGDVVGVVVELTNLSSANIGSDSAPTEGEKGKEGGEVLTVAVTATTDGGVSVHDTVAVNREATPRVVASLTDATTESAQPEGASAITSLVQDQRENGESAYDWEIYEHLKICERKRPSPSFLKSTRNIKERIRKIMIDWLIKVHYTLQLDPETLFLTVTTLDRFTALTNPSRDNYQLISVAILLLCSKIEDVRPPKIEDLMQITNHAFTREQIVKMEYSILAILKFDLVIASPFQFLNFFLSTEPLEEAVQFSALFLLESTLMESSMYHFQPSLLAAASLYIARSTHQLPPWPSSFHRFYPDQHDPLLTCAEAIIQHLNRLKKSLTIKGLTRKYSIPQYCSVSELEYMT